MRVFPRPTLPAHRAGFAWLALALAAPLAASPAFEEATALFRAQRYPEARPLLEAVVTAEPDNAEACFQLGMTWRNRNDPEALAEGIKWLDRATELAPKQTGYWLELGAAALQLAGKKSSLALAQRGREALEKVLALDPAHLDAREFLFRYYAEAPWPIGSKTKAAVQLDAIRPLDPNRADLLDLQAKGRAKDYAGALAAGDALLAREPKHRRGLYHWARVALAGGLELERAAVRLEACAEATHPGDRDPTPAQVWQKLAETRLRLQQKDLARAACTQGLAAEPGHRALTELLRQIDAPPAQG
jgi:tetratricopeptide (TPR) repeat protein